MGKIMDKVKGFYNRHKLMCNIAFIGSGIGGAAFVVYVIGKSIQENASNEFDGILISKNNEFYTGFSLLEGAVEPAKNAYFRGCDYDTDEGLEAISLSDCGKLGELVLENALKNDLDATIDDTVHGVCMLYGDRVKEVEVTE